MCSQFAQAMLNRHCRLFKLFLLEIFFTLLAAKRFTELIEQEHFQVEEEFQEAVHAVEYCIANGVFTVYRVNRRGILNFSMLLEK